MNEFKEKYYTDDFQILDWHDNIIHSIMFNTELREIAFEVDYIQNIENNKYLLSPMQLKFFNVYDLDINIKWSDSALELSIFEIKQKNKRMTPNKKFVEWDWIIDIDWPKPGGYIAYSSTGFEMIAYCKPILNENYSLPSIIRDKIVTEFKTLK